jgi:uncharacterized protein (TIGR02646 family)
MIRVHRPPILQHLTRAERARLSRKQAEANEYGRQDAGIERAWRSFRKAMIGKRVERALRAVFRSKCAFCERVNAKTADHFYPKQRYPKRMFRWSNLLLCCGECNPAKGSYFPFVNGHPLLIDPSREDPLIFFTWDFQTGAMVESINPERGPRARATRDRLKLDEGPLRDERRVQFLRVVKLLCDVVNEHPDIPRETRQMLEEELHPDRPYLGIIRFLFREPNAYRAIVDDARAKLPDIDAWTAGWL